MLDEIKKLVIQTKNLEKSIGSARLIAGWVTNDRIDAAMRNSIKIMGSELHVFEMDDELKTDLRRVLVEFALRTEKKADKNNEKLQAINSLINGN